MSNVEAMIAAVDFVEDHLKADITVADMADAVSYSLYHFCRMFNRVVHHTPYDYLMRRRLSESARELLETDRRIIEIALDYRFNNPETYSRAFKRMFGVQPYRCRKRVHLDRRAMLSRLTAAHIEHINRGDYLNPVMEEGEVVRVLGIMTLVREDAGEVSQLWELLGTELKGAEGQDGSGPYLGITLYPEDWEEKGVLYLAGVEGAFPDVSAGALVAKTLPRATYARFVHKGLYQDLGLTKDYVYQTWLPRSSWLSGGRYEIEHYGDRWPDLSSPEAEWALLVPIEEC
jgi:AraC family transcriptional regulator